MQRVRVLIVDDSKAVREGLRQLLALEDDIQVVGEAGDGWESIEQASRCTPDVVLMDVNLPSLNGIDATRRIKRKFPQMSVVFLAAEAIWHDQGLAAGGDAYITKGEPTDRLLAAIRGQLVEEPLPVGERRGPAPLVSTWVARLRCLLPSAPLIAAQTLKALTSLSGLAAFRRKPTGALVHLPSLARKRLMGQLWPQLKETFTHDRLGKLAWAVLILGLLVSIYLVADLPGFLKQVTLGGVIAGISLTFGIFFFLYAARYYSVIALILLFSGGGNFNNGDNFHNGPGSGAVNGVRNGSRNGLRNGLKNSLRNGVRRLFSHQGESNGVYDGLNGVMKNGLRNGLRQLFLHNGLKNGLGNGLRNGLGNGLRNGLGNRLRNGIFNGLYNGNRRLNAENLPLHLDGQPFVSIHLPLYNENRVVERLLTACTSLNYDNYEVLVADDSSDETLEYLEEWAKHPRIKVSHRINRQGYKGAALKHAVEVMDPRTEFVMVFDADFIPPPDIIWQCLAYFFGENGDHNNHNWRNDGRNNNGGSRYVDDRIAVVQGYQWHMLNADENWITKGIRVEYSGSYVIERSSQELLGAMKMISGSVYMIRADVLRKLGWGTSITEDWELTIRLYLDGYKVLYTPFIQAPAECVSTLRRLIRQRMRWAEGHTYNVKKFFPLVMASPNISLREKLEFLYYAPYYLQSAFFIIGTACWFLSEILMHGKLPQWTSLLGWSLVFTNMGALALMNLSGLFMERGVKHEWDGVLSAMLLGIVLVPFQAYAALKGLLEDKEGGWFRTPKSGKITEFFDRLDLGDKLRSLLPRRRRRGHSGQVSKATDVGGFSWLTRRRSRLAYGLISVMLAGVLTLGSLAVGVPAVSAGTPEAGNWYLHPDAVLDGYLMDLNVGSTLDIITFNEAADDYYWYSPALPTGVDDATIAAGGWQFEWHHQDLSGLGTGAWVKMDFEVGYVDAATGLNFVSLGSVSKVAFKSTNGVGPTTVTIAAGVAQQTFTAASPKRLRLQIQFDSNNKGTTLDLRYDDTHGNNGDSHLITPQVVVPEGALALLLVVPFLPLMVRRFRRAKGAGMVKRERRRGGLWVR